MGTIIKYNLGKDDEGKRVKGSTFGGSSGGYPSSTTINTAGEKFGCELWGNDFDGITDLNGSMYIQGDVEIRFNAGDGSEDDDESDFDPDQLEEDEDGNPIYPKGNLSVGGDITCDNNITGTVINGVNINASSNITAGSNITATGNMNCSNLNASSNATVGSNLTVTNKTTTRTLEAQSGYIKELYIDYPEVKTDETNKTDVVDLFKDLQSQITTNATNISNCHSQCMTNASDIDDIEDRLYELENGGDYDKNAPVILFSGIIHSNNNDGSLTYQPWVVRPLCYAQHTGVDKIELDYLVVGGEKKCTLVVKVNAKDGWYVKPMSMHSTVSLDSHCNPAVDFGGNRRSQGYWTTGGVFPTGDLYIQVWRTEDANNDSTKNDQVAYSAQEINLTIFGLAYKN